MRRNQVIYNRKLSHNIEGWPGYHISKRGRLYKYYPKKVEVVKDRWTDGLALEISHNGWQTTSISNLDVEDLKRIRKVIRKAIRNHENNKSV